MGGNLLSHIYNNTLCSYCGNITTDENTDCSRFPKEMIYVQCAFITLLIKTNKITFVLFPKLRLFGNQHLLQTLIGEGCKILQMEFFGVQTLLVWIKSQIECNTCFYLIKEIIVNFIQKKFLWKTRGPRTINFPLPLSLFWHDWN